MNCGRCGVRGGGAEECSPGRKPGVNSKAGSQPQRGERFEWIRGILRPYGAGTSTLFHPRACARGYILTPLRGWNAQIVIHSHVLAPGATLCRRSAASDKEGNAALPLLGHQRHLHVIVRIKISFCRLLDRSGVEFLVQLRRFPDAGHVLAYLILRRNLAQQKSVLFAAGLEFPEHRFLFVLDFLFSRTFCLQFLYFLEHAFDKGLGALRVAAELDRCLVLLAGNFLLVRADIDAVGAAQLFAKDPEQPRFQYVRHGAYGGPVGRVILEGSGENDCGLALRLDPFLDRFLNDPDGWTHSNIFPGLCAMDRWQAAKISLDERFHRGEVKASDEKEREVARIGEAVFIERKRFVEIPLINGGGCRDAPARMILAQDDGERFGKRKLGKRRLVRKRGPGSCRLDSEGVLVGPRLREPEENELKHCFKILAGAAAGQAFFGFSDEGAHIGDLARQHLLQIDRAKVPQAAGAEDLCGGAGRNVVPIAGERCTAGTCGAEYDFILTERGRFEDDFHTIGQLPLGNADWSFRGGLNDGAYGRQWIEQSCRCDLIEE